MRSNSKRRGQLLEALQRFPRGMVMVGMQQQLEVGGSLHESNER